MSDWRIEAGDCRDVLRQMPAQSVHTVVTSPPYFGLRDYGTGEWEGGDPACEHKGAPRQSTSSTLAGNGHGPDRLSPSLQAQTVPVRECPCGARRTDRQIGLEPTPDEFVAALVAVFDEVWRVMRDDATLWINLGDAYGPGKQLLGMPWRVAFALQARGWCLRSDVIWAKLAEPDAGERDGPADEGA